MPAYPLIVNIRHEVQGSTFNAWVGATLRGLIVHEPDQEDSWCLYGAQPGGLIEYGKTPQAAYQKFCVSVRQIVDESAESADSFDQFSQDLTDFFSQPSAPVLEQWEAARQAVRKGLLDAHETMGTVRKVTDESPAGIVLAEVKADASQPFEPVQAADSQLAQAA